MGIRGIGLIAFSVLFSACAHAQLATSTPAPSNAWSKIKHPTGGNPLSIGFYSLGCIAGASTLPLDGTGFQVMKTLRNRYYGHPTLIDFITRLGKSLDAVDSAILIGDMSQPRGGPLPYGHASHQVGLDVDIWYWTHPDQRVRSLTEVERNTLEMKTVLNSNGLVDPTKFTAETITKLKLSATDPTVERIFVNPAIKTYLCSTLPASELYWLHTLRPWTGHDDHFHVRLQCSSDSPNCTHQTPQDAGDGCKELMPPRSGEGDNGGADLDLNHPQKRMSPEIENLVNATATTAIPSACTKLLKE